MPKIFFAPLNSSWGHIGRTLAIADKLSAKYTKIILISKEKRAFLKNKGYLTETVPGININLPLRSYLAKYKKLILKYKPDKIIIDNDPFALITAFELKIPTIEIHTPSSWAGQLLLGEEQLAGNDILFLKELLKIFPLAFIKSFLLRKNKILVPSILSLEKKKFEHGTFIGPQFWQGWQNLRTLKSSGSKSVFLTFGSANIPKTMLQTIRSACKANNLNLIYSNELINNKDSIEQADLVICHGGHTTILEALSSGKPLLCLPQNKDQAIASNIIIQKKLGLILKNGENLSSALKKLQQPIFQKNCAKLQKQLCSIPAKGIKI